MAKRVRGSRSAHRPGGQGPSRARRTDIDGATAPDDALPASADDLVTDADYSEVEVDEAAVAALAAATPASAPEQELAPRRSRRKARKQRPSDLAARVAAEDVWVRQDLRRIGVVSMIQLAALAVAWVLFGLLDVLSLY